jgi:hypothetical protein
MPPAIPHAVSLKKSKIGTEKEHWALHVHPVEEGKGKLHVLHAVSDPDKLGVLAVDHVKKGVYTGPSTKSDSQIVHLGNFATHSQAMEAINGVKKNVELHHSFPDENCVDFCHAAVHHMVANHGLDQQAATIMDSHYNAEEAGVRDRTGTAHNKEAAGVPMSPT